jgi:hypothetical protein
MNHKLYPYPVSRKLYTKRMEKELASLNRKDLWVQFLLWWHKPKLLLLQSTFKNLWLMRILKWQFLKQPNLNFLRVCLTLFVLLMAWDGNTSSTERLWVTPEKRKGPLRAFSLAHGRICPWRNPYFLIPPALINCPLFWRLRNLGEVINAACVLRRVIVSGQVAFRWAGTRFIVQRTRGVKKGSWKWRTWAETDE